MHTLCVFVCVYCENRLTSQIILTFGINIGKLWKIIKQGTRLGLVGVIIFKQGGHIGPSWGDDRVLRSLCALPVGGIMPCFPDARASAFQFWPHASRCMVSSLLHPLSSNPWSYKQILFSKSFRNGENAGKSVNGQHKVNSYERLIIMKTLYFPSRATCITTTTPKRGQIKYYQPWNDIMDEISLYRSANSFKDYERI